jgi:hypothetical protein
MEDEKKASTFKTKGQEATYRQDLENALKIAEEQRINSSKKKSTQITQMTVSNEEQRIWRRLQILEALERKDPSFTQKTKSEQEELVDAEVVKKTAKETKSPVIPSKIITSSIARENKEKKTEKYSFSDDLDGLKTKDLMKKILTWQKEHSAPFRGPTYFYLPEKPKQTAATNEINAEKSNQINTGKNHIFNNLIHTIKEINKKRSPENKEALQKIITDWKNRFSPYLKDKDGDNRYLNYEFLCIKTGFSKPGSQRIIDDLLKKLKPQELKPSSPKPKSFQHFQPWLRL